MIHLCDALARRSSLLRIGKCAPLTPSPVTFVNVMGKQNVSCPFPPSDSSQDAVDLLESCPLYKRADRFPTAVERINGSCTHKQFKKV